MKTLPTKAAVTLAGMLVLAGCQGGHANQPPSIQTLYKSDHCGTSTPELALGKSADDTDLSGDAARRLEQALEKGPVVRVSMGQQSSAGYGLRFQNARWTDKGLRIDLIHQQPEPTEMTAQMLTRPCLMLSLPEGDWQRLSVHSEGTGFPLALIRR